MDRTHHARRAVRADARARHATRADQRLDRRAQTDPVHRRISARTECRHRPVDDRSLPPSSSRRVWSGILVHLAGDAAVRGKVRCACGLRRRQRLRRRIEAAFCRSDFCRAVGAVPCERHRNVALPHVALPASPTRSAARVCLASVVFHSAARRATAILGRVAARCGEWRMQSSRRAAAGSPSIRGRGVDAAARTQTPQREPRECTRTLATPPHHQLLGRRPRCARARRFEAARATRRHPAEGPAGNRGIRLHPVSRAASCRCDIAFF